MEVDDAADLFAHLSIQPHIGSRFLTLLGSVEPNLIVNCITRYQDINPIFSCTIKFNRLHFHAWQKAVNLFYDTQQHEYILSYYKLMPDVQNTFYECQYHIEIHSKR
jgi:hypothetical protein